MKHVLFAALLILSVSCPTFAADPLASPLDCTKIDDTTGSTATSMPLGSSLSFMQNPNGSGLLVLQSWMGGHRHNIYPCDYAPTVSRTASLSLECRTQVGSSEAQTLSFTNNNSSLIIGTSIYSCVHRQ